MGCAGKLAGDFAFMLHDPLRGEIFCARDRAGVRPLYYHYAGDFFAAASEMKALLAHPAVPDDIDPVRVGDYLTGLFDDKEITFHKAGTTKDLELMMSLFADDAVLTVGGKKYAGKEEIRTYWQSAGTFQPQNQWVAYTPAFRIKYNVAGDHAHLYFECLYVDKVAQKIAAHTNSDDELVRVNGRWLIREMKAAAVPEI